MLDARLRPVSTVTDGPVAWTVLRRAEDRDVSRRRAFCDRPTAHRAAAMTPGFAATPGQVNIETVLNPERSSSADHVGIDTHGIDGGGPPPGKPFA